jgi:uncharacterized membrane protein
MLTLTLSQETLKGLKIHSLAHLYIFLICAYLFVVINFSQYLIKMERII